MIGTIKSMSHKFAENFLSVFSSGQASVLHFEVFEVVA